MNEKILLSVQTKILPPDKNELDRVKKEIKKGLQDSANINSKTSGIKLLDTKEIEIYQKKMQNAIERLKIGKDKIFSNTNIQKELKELENSVSRVGTVGGKSFKEVNLAMDTFRTNVKKLQGEFKNVNKDGYSFIEMTGLAIKKIGIWALSSTAVYLPIRAFQQGLQTLKEIDTQLVDIAKVTNLTKQEMQDLAVKASEVGIQFGRTAQEYLSAVTEFSKAGYDKSAEQLGKVSLLLQNVGDVNAETANSFLLATDAAYKMGGSEEKLTNTINGLNNVSNKNATTITKISEGMSVSASTAEQAGVGIEELSGAIATMTIVTQRSGAEAGRAFKGILMNIQQIKG